MNNHTERFSGREAGYNYPQNSDNIPQQSSAVYDAPSSLPKTAPEKDESEPTFRIIGFVLTSLFLVNALRLAYLHGSIVYLSFSSGFSFSNITALDVAPMVDFAKYALISFNLGKVLVVKKCAAGLPDPDNVNPFRWALYLVIINFFLGLYISRNYLAYFFQDLLLWTLVDLFHVSFYVSVYSSANFKTNFLRIMKPWEYED